MTAHHASPPILAPSLALAIAACLAACSEQSSEQSQSPQNGTDRAAPPQDERRAENDATDAGPWFVDATDRAGLGFTHFAGLTGQYYYVEIVPPGVALFDYDNDGDLDAYFVQGRVLEPGKSADDAFTDEPSDEIRLGNRLYRNDLIKDGVNTGELRFTDVTKESGAGVVGYGMAVTTADFTGDAHTDIFITNFGPDTLLLNNGDGTFRDASDTSGLDDPRWTTAATPVDFDLDGDLDLFVGLGGDFTVETAPYCERKPGVPDYCAPAALDGLPDRLYENDGTGVFTDASDRLSPTTDGHALGAVVADFDGNGWPDFYVANDGDANHLWLNTDGRFEESALLNSAAYNDMGQAEAGMGIAIADYDDDGDEDLFLTHLRGETNTLYKNDGNALFADTTVREGLSAPSRPYTAFGVGFIDADHDSDLDVFIANGDVRANDLDVSGVFPYDQPNQFMRNDGNNTFTDISETAGQAITRTRVSRGAAFGDIDLDGDVDILVTNDNGPAELLLNVAPKRGNSAFIEVLRPNGAPALGATVRATLSDGRVITRTVRIDGSYFSSSSPIVHMTWPEETSVEQFTVTIPGEMASSTRTGLDPGERTTVVLGSN